MPNEEVKVPPSILEENKQPTAAEVLEELTRWTGERPKTKTTVTAIDVLSRVDTNLLRLLPVLENLRKHCGDELEGPVSATENACAEAIHNIIQALVSDFVQDILCETQYRGELPF